MKVEKKNSESFYILGCLLKLIKKIFWDLGVIWIFWGVKMIKI